MRLKEQEERILYENLARHNMQSERACDLGKSALTRVSRSESSSVAFKPLSVAEEQQTSLVFSIEPKKNSSTLPTFKLGRHGARTRSFKRFIR